MSNLFINICRNIGVSKRRRVGVPEYRGIGERGTAVELASPIRRHADTPFHFLRLPLLLLLTTLLTVATSCRKESAGKPADVDYYTCTMHPSVRKQNPTDKCPICSMDLTPVKKKDSGGSASGDVDYYTCTMHPSVKKHSPT